MLWHIKSKGFTYQYLFTPEHILQNMCVQVKTGRGYSVLSYSVSLFYSHQIVYQRLDFIEELHSHLATKNRWPDFQKSFGQWVVSFIRSLAFSKHVNSNSWALNAFENVCIKMGARPFSRAVGSGHLSLSSSENPAWKVYIQKTYIQ